MTNNSKVSISNTKNTLNSNQSKNKHQLFDAIKNDLTDKRCFDRVLGYENLHNGTYHISNGMAVVTETDYHYIFQVSFDYEIVSDNGTICSHPKINKSFSFELKKTEKEIDLKNIEYPPINI